jgi:hypothetical protein
VTLKLKSRLPSLRQSLTIRLAKAIGKDLQLRNKVDHSVNSNSRRSRANIFLGRYHARVLKTPTEVRHALIYVLQKPALLFGAIARADHARQFFETGTPKRQRRLVPFLSLPKSWFLTLGWKKAKSPN